MSIFIQAKVRMKGYEPESDFYEGALQQNSYFDAEILFLKDSRFRMHVGLYGQRVYQLLSSGAGGIKTLMHCRTRSKKMI